MTINFCPHGKVRGNFVLSHLKEHVLFLWKWSFSFPQHLSPQCFYVDFILHSLVFPTSSLEHSSLCKHCGVYFFCWSIVFYLSPFISLNVHMYFPCMSLKFFLGCGQWTCSVVWDIILLSYYLNTLCHTLIFDSLSLDQKPHPVTVDFYVQMDEETLSEPPGSDRETDGNFSPQQQSFFSVTPPAQFPSFLSPSQQKRVYTRIKRKEPDLVSRKEKKRFSTDFHMRDWLIGYRKRRQKKKRMRYRK